MEESKFSHRINRERFVTICVTRPCKTLRVALARLVSVWVITSDVQLLVDRKSDVYEARMCAPVREGIG